MGVRTVSGDWTTVGRGLTLGFIAIAASAGAADATTYRTADGSGGVVGSGLAVYPLGDGVQDPVALLTTSLHRRRASRFSLQCDGTFASGSGAYIVPGGIVIEPTARRIWVLGTSFGVGRPGSLCAQAAAASGRTESPVVLMSGDRGRTFSLAPLPPRLAGPSAARRTPALVAAPEGRGVLYGSPVAGWVRYVPGTTGWTRSLAAGNTFGLTQTSPRTEWELGPPYNARFRRAFAPLVSRALDSSPNPRVWTQWEKKTVFDRPSYFTLRRGGRSIRTTRVKLRLKVHRGAPLGRGACDAPAFGYVSDVSQAATTSSTRIVWGLTEPVASYICHGRRRTMDVDARLVRSTDYGRTWRVALAPPGPLVEVVAVDDGDPVVSTGTCRAYEARQFRLQRGRWRSLGCRPSA